MKKHITYPIIVLGLAAMVMTACLGIQGCSSSDEGWNSITGPAPAPVQDNPANGAILSERQPDQGRGDVIPVNPGNPGPACEIQRTGELVFVNNSHWAKYFIRVNGKDRGVLAPGGNMLVTVPEGDVKWEAFRAAVKYGPDAYGSIFVKRCQQYLVRIDTDPRQPWEMENVNE